MPRISCWLEGQRSPWLDLVWYFYSVYFFKCFDYIQNRVAFSCAKVVDG